MSAGTVAPELCSAALTGEGYWTCDVPGMCADCKWLAFELARGIR